MIVNSKIKYRSKIMVGVNKYLVLDFILCYWNFWFSSSSFFVTVLMRKDVTHVISAQGTIQNTLYINWGIK